MSEPESFLKYLLQNDNNKTYMLQGASLGFLLFILSLEIKPNMRNIWFRNTSTGKKTIQPRSLLNYLTLPFKNKWVWKKDNWDLNFLIVSGLIGGTYTLLRQTHNYHFPKT